MDWNDLNLENSYTAFKAYKQSKLANVLFTLALDKRFNNSGITSVSLHPGEVRTEIFRNRLSNPIVSFVVFLLSPLFLFFFKNCKQGYNLIL